MNKRAKVKVVKTSKTGLIALSIVFVGAGWFACIGHYSPWVIAGMGITWLILIIHWLSKAK